MVRDDRLRPLVVGALLVVAAVASASPVSVRYPRRTPLDSSELAVVVRDVTAEQFRDERVAALERHARMHWFLADQLRVLVPLFGWREDRLRALALTAPLLLDRQHTAALLALFPDDRTRAAELLGVAP